MLLNRVAQFARRHNLWRPETRVIAAVSGGSDSVALLFLLHELHQRGDLTLDAVAHLNHSIRGTAADEDQAFVETLAARLGVACVSAVVDVPSGATRRGLSIEVAARQARHRFFAEVKTRRSADAVATAHTRDDQAETVLLRLVRGTGLHGISGIAPHRDSLIRPLLECTHDELRRELTARGEAWREDATNSDLANPRNRMRHELLPYLAQHFNPSIDQALARFADHARADAAHLDEQAAAASHGLLQVAGARVSIHAARLTALPPAIARRVVQRALDALGANASGVQHVDLVRSVAARECKGAEFGSVRVVQSGESVVLEPIAATGGDETSKQHRFEGAFRFELPIPGSVGPPHAGWVLEAEGPLPRTNSISVRPSIRDDEVEVEAADLGRALVVRSRQPGDRFRPLGLGGSKKVQDVFVDHKVSRSTRDQVPIVTDERGRIVWVAGHALAEEFRVTTDTNAVVVLKLRRI